MEIESSKYFLSSFVHCMADSVSLRKLFAFERQWRFREKFLSVLGLGQILLISVNFPSGNGYTIKK